MERNPDLLRAILLRAKNEVEGLGRQRLRDVDGFTKTETGYHLQLLIEAEFMHGEVVTSEGGDVVVMIMGPLKMAGHDFLELAEIPTIWERTKEALRTKSLPATMDVITDVAKAYATKKLGLD